jgi:hypothetical protein
LQPLRKINFYFYFVYYSKFTFKKKSFYFLPIMIYYNGDKFYPQNNEV